jgi:hypothetical protein
LYVARWPDGTATVFTAHSMEHAVDRIDEIDEPGECEVAQIVESAHRMTDDGETVEEDIDPVRWRDAVAMEANRILAPSPDLKHAIDDWWDALGPRATSPDDHD